MLHHEAAVAVCIHAAARKMKRAPFFLAAGLLLLCIPNLAAAEGDINFIIGVRSPSHEAWKPVDDDINLGIAVDWGRDSWPIRIAVGYQTFGESGKGGCFIVCRSPDALVQQTIDEFYVGIAKYWKPGTRTRFYWGGGLTNVTAKMEATSTGPLASDDSLGLYTNAAVVWLLGGEPETQPHLNLGLEGRYVTATDVELFGESFNANYLQISLIGGVGW